MNPWESDYEGALIVLKFFWSLTTPVENSYIEGGRKLHGLSEYVISFKK